MGRTRTKYNQIDNVASKKIQDEFHPFPRLPVELRLKIWSFANLEPKNLLIEWRGIRTRRLAPVILRINHETREEFSKQYVVLQYVSRVSPWPKNIDVKVQPWQLSSGAGWSWFNPSRDFIRITQEELFMNTSFTADYLWPGFCKYIQRLKIMCPRKAVLPEPNSVVWAAFDPLELNLFKGLKEVRIERDAHWPRYQGGMRDRALSSPSSEAQEDTLLWFEDIYMEAVDAGSSFEAPIILWEEADLDGWSFLDDAHKV